MIKFMGVEINRDECNDVGVKWLPNVGLCYNIEDMIRQHRKLWKESNASKTDPENGWFRKKLSIANDPFNANR